jgi:2'-5' RNA ligase
MVDPRHAVSQDSTESYWAFQPGQRVMTREGFTGVVTEVEESFAGGDESYIVTLNHGMGGGAYASHELAPALSAEDPRVEPYASRTASLQNEVEEEDEDDEQHHVASEDYPELADILVERPPLEHASKIAVSYEEYDDGTREQVADEAPCDHFVDTPDSPGICANCMWSIGAHDVSAGGPDGYGGFGPYLGALTATRWFLADTDGTITDGPFSNTADAELVRQGDPTVQLVPDTDQQEYAGWGTENDQLRDIGTGGEEYPQSAFSESYSATTAGIIEHITPEKYRYDPNGNWSYDWCRFRKKEHCFYPREMDAEATKAAGYTVWKPFDRGFCPRPKWDDQKACPVGEPGPNSGDPHAMVDATIPWEEGGQHGGFPVTTSLEHHLSLGRLADVLVEHEHDDEAALDLISTASADPSFGFHLTATWKDVQTKAKRIRTEGGVRIIAASNSDITAEVRGDTDVYQTRLMRQPGRKAVAMWECGCAWGKYSWGRSGRWKRYEGRMCSHALALNYEAAAQEWMGGTITEQQTAPEWSKGVKPQVWSPAKPPSWMIGQPRRVSTSAALKPSLASQLHVAYGDGPFGQVGGRIVQLLALLPGGKVRIQGDQIVPASEVLHPRYSPDEGLDFRPTASLHQAQRYVVRVGDDGNPKSRHDTLSEARDAAKELSLTGWSGKGQIIDTEKGGRESWSNGEQVGRGLLEDGAASSDYRKCGHPNAYVTEDNETYCPDCQMYGVTIPRTSKLAWTEPGTKAYDAHTELNNAVRDGDKKKPSKCQSCGKGGQINGHHADYDKPLDVKWLCNSCHQKEHAKESGLITFEEGDLYQLMGELALPPWDDQQGGYLGGNLDCAPMASHIDERVQQTRIAASDSADMDGCMVALPIRGDLAAELASFGGEDVDNMHVTLAYLGKAAGVDRERLSNLVSAYALEASPLTGRIAGYAVFVNDTGRVLVALPDVPGLNEWRAELANRLNAAGFEVADTHGFTPHITIMYEDTDAPALFDGTVLAVSAKPPQATLTFDTCVVAYGEDWTDYPLEGGQGNLSVAAARAVIETYRGVKLKISKGSDWGYVAVTVGGQPHMDRLCRLDDPEQVERLMRELRLTVDDAGARPGAYEDNWTPKTAGAHEDLSAFPVMVEGDALGLSTTAVHVPAAMLLAHAGEYGGNYCMDHGFEAWEMAKTAGYEPEIMYHEGGGYLKGCDVHLDETTVTARAAQRRTEIDPAFLRTAETIDTTVDMYGDDESVWFDPTPQPLNFFDPLALDRDEDPEANVHRPPEPALPVAEAAPEPVVASLAPTGEPSLAELQAGLTHLMDGAAPAVAAVDNADIAAGAQAFLARTAAKRFSPAEQRAIINEAEGVGASNLDLLQLEGTHYALVEDDDDTLW